MLGRTLPGRRASFALAQSANTRLASIGGHVLNVFARRTANDAIEIPRRQTAHITFNAYAQPFCFETYLIASPSHSGISDTFSFALIQVRRLTVSQFDGSIFGLVNRRIVRHFPMHAQWNFLGQIATEIVQTTLVT